MFNLANISILFLCSVAVFLGGCSTTATISRVNAPDIEVQIQRSDSENIYVGHGSGMTIPRNTISDIDHPGNVAATIGAIITGYGVVNIIAGASDCERGGAAYCTGVFLPATIGIPILTWGLATWSSSVKAASPSSENTQPSFAVVPTISVDKKNEYVGASATVRF